MPRRKESCTCLRSIDQLGVPVTLNWAGDDVYKTKIGGLCSIFGIIFVGAFVVGTFYTYFTFK